MTTRPNIYDYLKVTALITMVIDHVWFLLYPEIEILRIIWRIAFPLFLFLVWYNHSYKRKSWLRRRAILLQIWLRWASRLGYLDIYTANILIGIGLTRIILWYIQSQTSRSIQYIYSGILAIWSIRLLPYSLQIFDYWSMCLVYWFTGYRWRIWWESWKKPHIYVMYIWILLLNMFHIYTSTDYILWSITPRWVYLVWIVLLLSMCMALLSRKNTSIVTRHIQINTSILFLSRYALVLYVAQIIIIGLIYLSMLL